MRLKMSAVLFHQGLLKPHCRFKVLSDALHRINIVFRDSLNCRLAQTYDLIGHGLE